MERILVVGSLNIDHTVQVDHIPRVGETIISRESTWSYGGKGANQSIALKKLGSEVSLIGAIGDDQLGTDYVEYLKKLGIPINGIIRKQKSESGTAFICIDYDGRNMIIVDKGANALLSEGDIRNMDGLFEGIDYCLMQLEIPLETVYFVAKKCCERGIRVFLNPAPASGPLSSDLLQHIYCLVPNETELENMTGNKVSLENVEEQARILLKKGVQSILVTLGEKGSLYVDKEKVYHVPSIKTKAVDTTAAGDSFLGGYLSELARGSDVREAMEFATRVASITVSRRGASSSIPTLEEMKTFKEVKAI